MEQQLLSLLDLNAVGHIGLVTVNIDHTYLQRTGLVSTCGIGRKLLLALVVTEGADADVVSHSCGEACEGKGRRIGGGATHLLPVLSIQLHLDGKTLLGVGVITPSECQGRRRTGRCAQRNGLAQEVLTVLDGDGVDIVLDVEVAVGSLDGGISLILVGAIGLLPSIGHTVTIGIGGFVTSPPGPSGRTADGETLFVRYQGTLRTHRHQLVNHVTVTPVAVGQRSTYHWDIEFDELITWIQLQGGIVVRVGGTVVGGRIIGHLVGVVLAILIVVLPVIDAVAMELLVGVRKTVGGGTCRGTIDEKVALDVDVRRTLRVATHDIGTVGPVIDHVVGILVDALHLVVAGGVVDIKVAVEGDIVGLHQSAGRVCHQALAKDTVHQGDVMQLAFAVGIDGEGLVQAPREGAVVEDHVRTAGNAGTILA